MAASIAMNRSTVFSIFLFVASTLFSIGIAEGVLRVKNASMRNYDIEMWRYARELKMRSPNNALGHEHIPNAAATLQSVEIRTNEFGLRGGPVREPAPARRILFLGSSITLGWGVPEDETVSALVEEQLKARGEDVEVLNAGIGNYNAARYVALYETHLRPLKPTDIVVHYFLRDAEELDPGGGNFLLRHSQLAVTLWIAYSRLAGETGERSLSDHYQKLYAPGSRSFARASEALEHLAALARQDGVRIYLAIVPDVHNLDEYKFGFIHERVRALAENLGYKFADLLPAFGNLSPQQVWAMPGDPHPNALGHKLMADRIVELLSIP